jgi:hypothetical protein
MTGASGYVHTRINAGCCGPFALHVATGLPYGTIMATMEQLLGKRKSWQGSAWMNELTTTLEALGVPYERPTWPVRQMVLEVAWPERAYERWPLILHIPGHYVTLFDGLLIDQTAALPPYEHHNRHSFVKDAIQIRREPKHGEEELI